MREYYSVGYLVTKLRKSKSKIFSSLLKNGYSSFSLEILEYCDIDQLTPREQYYLDLLNPEYNILTVAGSRSGHKHYKEARAKMRAKALTPERLSNLNRIREKFKSKILNHLKLLNINPEHRERMKRILTSPKHLEHLTRLRSTPGIQAKRLAALKVNNSSPKHLEHLNRLNSSLEHKEHLNRINLLRSQQVSVLDTQTNETTVYPSLSEAARAIEVNLSTIALCITSWPGCEVNKQLINFNT